MLRVAYLVLAVCLLSSCTRLADAVRYEASITRVKQESSRLPRYDVARLEQRDIIERLEEAGFNSFHWLSVDQKVMEWHRRSRFRDRPVNIKSVSKVLASTLIGQTASKGALDTAAPISHFGDCDVPDALAPLNLDVLLNMQAGFEFSENQTNSVYVGKNWACNAMELPVEARSGTRFNYSTLQYHLAGLDTSQQTGAEFDVLLQTSLLTPIGIDLDGWVVNADGDVFVGSEFLLQPLDMLRFGQVMLNDGVWAGTQIVPREWVARTRRPVSTETGRSGLSYAWGWWLTEIANTEVQIAEGYGGQGIVIVPKADTVFVFTAPSGGLVSENEHSHRIDAIFQIVAGALAPGGQETPNLSKK